MSTCFHHLATSISPVPAVDDRQVFVTSRAASYEPAEIRAALEDLFSASGAGAALGSRSRVLIKPNWVLHHNASGAGLDCLVTNAALVEALAERAFEWGAGQVILADAPLQACDFSQLRVQCGLDPMAARLSRHGHTEIRDLRLVTRTGRDLWSSQGDSTRTLDQYIVFDLGRASALEPVMGNDGRLRVTGYDPAALAGTHGPGRHCYLVARELIEADLVINVPKLKTHKKAGLTAALKNLVGINGHKSYLPHHRKGSRHEGGDGYLQRSTWKRGAEFALDRGNAASTRWARYLWGRLAGRCLALDSSFGGDRNIEGAWHGNDTLWRTVLDLQRIACYGTPAGTLAATPQRRILHVTDAVIAGQGDGPLAPVPAPLGLLSMAWNAAALDWVNALLLGLDPRAIPSVREAFHETDRYPLASFAPDRIEVQWDGRPLDWRAVGERCARPVCTPEGWAGHCEWMFQRRTGC